VKPNSQRSVQSRTGKGIKGLCEAWLKSMLCNEKERTATEYHEHMQEAFDAITELQSVWREWAYGGAESMECLRRVSQIQFYIASDVWAHMKRDKQAMEMTKLYAESLPYIAAMSEAIMIDLNQKSPVEKRSELLASRLSPNLFGAKRTIPRAGSTVPDNLARSGEYNYRWDNLPPYDWKEPN
jgi:hypothetical protein